MNDKQGSTPLFAERNPIDHGGAPAWHSRCGGARSRWSASQGSAVDTAGGKADGGGSFERCGRRGSDELFDGNPYPYPLFLFLFCDLVIGVVGSG